MIISKIEIQRFRGFKNVGFNLGSQLTVLAGKNGTQKTTLLGMLSQPFTITDDANPMKKEVPLTGGSFKSAFSDKFKLSATFDIPKSHEWTLHVTTEPKPYVLESIDGGAKRGIRFWKKGDKGKGSGYIQLPVIFLSLQRLIPIGEDNKLKTSSRVSLTPAEEKFYREYHNKIMISTDTLGNLHYLESPSKNTLGINTSSYDWMQNSAGQDNLGKILLAILSFKRLKEIHPHHYKGGILVIDELDATLYPGSQIKLIDALRKFASDYSIQIIFSTHSLPILEKVCELQETFKKIPATKDQINVLFLEKKNNDVVVLPDVTINTIKHRLNVTIESKTPFKIPSFAEDKEGVVFAKALLKSRASKLKFIDCTISCSGLIDLPMRKIPPFIFPNAFIFLDGDVRGSVKDMIKVKKIKNIVILPGTRSPERLLADYLWNLDDNSPLWASIAPSFDKSYCFKDYKLNEIEIDRLKAKAWFNSHLKLWGTNGNKVINSWASANSADADRFLNEFVNTYNKFAKELSIKAL